MLEEYDIELEPITNRLDRVSVLAIIASNCTTHLIAYNYTDKLVIIQKEIKLRLFKLCNIKGIYLISADNLVLNL